jgi:acyl-CoA thioesterase-1
MMDRFRRKIPPTCLAGLALLAACAGGERPKSDAAAAGASTPAPVILVVGTSITAGLGVDPSEAYPAILQQKIDSAGFHYRVVNAGNSGETSAGVVRRMEWLLRQPIAVLILETGGNDGLRGLDPDSLRDNIEASVRLARRQTPPPAVLLLGMEAPPNLGPGYTARFREAFRAASRELDVPLVPFVLQGVGGIDSLNQADGIHPTAAGHRILAATVWTALLPLLEEGGHTR